MRVMSRIGRRILIKSDIQPTPRQMKAKGGGRKNVWGGFMCRGGFDIYFVTFLGRGLSMIFWHLLWGLKATGVLRDISKL